MAICKYGVVVTFSFFFNGQWLTFTSKRKLTYDLKRKIMNKKKKEIERRESFYKFTCSQEGWKWISNKIDDF